MSDPACSCCWALVAATWQVGHQCGARMLNPTYKCCLQVSCGNGIAETFLGVPAELSVPAAPPDNEMVPVLGVSPTTGYPGMASKLGYLPPGVNSPQRKGRSLAGVVNCPGRQAETPLHRLSICSLTTVVYLPPAVGEEGFRWGACARLVLRDLNPALLGPGSSFLAPPAQCLWVLSLPFLLRAVPYLSPRPSVPA